jgi:uncharacterized protein YecT (DUF1311 family)
MRHGWDLGRAVAFAALIGLAALGLAAGCGSTSSSSSPSSTSSGSTATATPSGPASAQTTSAPPFADIVEPFDPGHPAQAKSAPADCGSQSSTLAIVQCFENQTETTDAQIDTVGRQLYKTASLVTAKTAIVAQLGAWLTARGPVCQAAFHTGGTIDQVNIASCLLDESTARLDAMKNITPPEAKLKSTDSTDPSQLSWYTTPEGSRIAEIDTQGDQTGGAVISWVIIGGAQGFVVNPKQFFFQDGAFTDPGVIQGANPTYHQVATGQLYQFGIDYSKLSKDPNASKGSGGYVYVPGTPVAIWQ